MIPRLYTAAFGARPRLGADVFAGLGAGARHARPGMVLSGRGRDVGGPRARLVSDQDPGAARHAPPGRLAAGEPADHRAHARHRARPRLLPDADARCPSRISIRRPLDPQVGSALVLLYPAAIAYATVRYRLFDASVVIRRSRRLHRARRTDHGGLRARHRRRQRAAHPERRHALALVLGRLHVRGRARLLPRARAAAARGRPDVLPRALRPRADDPDPRALDDEPARPRRDHAPAHRHHRIGHARPRRPPAGGPSGASGDRCAGRRARCHHPLSGGRRSDLRRPGSRFTGRVARPRRRGRGAATVRRGAARPAPAGPEALGGAPIPPTISALLETVADQTAVAVANAEAHRRVLDYARELERSLHDPDQPGEVRPPARSPAHRGVARSARRSTSARRT